MMVAGNRGFMPLEAREQNGRTGNAIRRIPLIGQNGQLKSEYYCYWQKDRTGEMRKRYGFIYVDKHDDGTGDLHRARKYAFYWYQRCIAINGEGLDWPGRCPSHGNQASWSGVS